MKPDLHLGRAAVTGAIVVLGTFLVKEGLPLDVALDPFVWMFLGMIAAFGAILGVAGALAWQHVSQSRSWLLWTALCLILLSVWIVVPFIQKTRANNAFLATADSTRGLVERKIWRGGPRLSVTYEVAGETHTFITPGAGPPTRDVRYDQWKSGDSLWVYYQAGAPDSARVGRFGPSPTPTLEMLGWLWSVGGILLLGYLPFVVEFLKWWRSELKASSRPTPQQERERGDSRDPARQ